MPAHTHTKKKDNVYQTQHQQTPSIIHQHKRSIHYPKGRFKKRARKGESKKKKKKEKEARKKDTINVEHSSRLYIGQRPGLVHHLVAAQLLLQLVRHKALVVVQALLHVNLELDDVVEHAVNLRVQLFS